MKKTISILLTALIALCISVSVNASEGLASEETIQLLEDHGYYYITETDLDASIDNLTGMGIYTVFEVQEIENDCVKAEGNEDDYTFLVFNTVKDYRDYVNEGDLVAVYGVVGEPESFLGVNLTSVNDTTIIAVGENAEPFDKGETDVAYSGYKVTSDSIDAFKYEIIDNRVILHGMSSSFKGDSVIIQPQYEIDNILYQTDLSDFQVGIGNSGVKHIEFAEGITMINDAVFNSCDVEEVVFPISLESIDDKLLSYLHPEDGEKIQIYYAGSENDWNRIFSVYEAQSVSEAEWGEEKGIALADKLNKLMGSDYNPGDFEFHFDYLP